MAGDFRAFPSSDPPHTLKGRSRACSIIMGKVEGFVSLPRSAGPYPASNPKWDSSSPLACQPPQPASAELKRRLTCSRQEIYAELSPQPIAAASLGQVYKVSLPTPTLLSSDPPPLYLPLFSNGPPFPSPQGKLKTGEQVAVKVQRPYVLETVTVDLFILRAIGVRIGKILGDKVETIPALYPLPHCPLGQPTFLQSSPALPLT